MDIVSGNGVVIGCALAGLLMRASSAHLNTNLNYTLGNITATGTLRAATTEDDSKYKFFDVLTILSGDEMNSPTKLAQRDQGRAIAERVMAYLYGENANPDGWGDAIEVLCAP